MSFVGTQFNPRELIEHVTQVMDRSAKFCLFCDLMENIFKITLVTKEI